MKKKYDTWTTAAGKEIPVPVLTTIHLRNIIRDGYRNPAICAEAERRKIPIPKLKPATQKDVFMFVEAVHSSAIADNSVAKRMRKIFREEGWEACVPTLEMMNAQIAFDKMEEEQRPPPSIGTGSDTTYLKMP